MIDTWTCHICGEERPDEKISVVSSVLDGLPNAEINIRYCNDKFKCEKLAFQAADNGKFPKRIKSNKRWWEFWK